MRKAYSGYLAPYVHLIQAMDAQGTPIKQIASALYQAGVRSPDSRPEGVVDPVASMGGLIRHMLRKDGATRRRSLQARITRLENDLAAARDELKLLEPAGEKKS